MLGGKSHIELRADFPGGFPSHTRNAFTQVGRTATENDMFSFSRTLLRLKKTHKALTHGKMIHYPPSYEADVYKYLRMDEDEKILVIINGHKEERMVDVSEVSHWFSSSQQLLNLMTGKRMVDDVCQGISVEGWGVVILQLVEKSMK